ncbi:MAG: twin-arginine translocation signal domain-containing protein [Gammaproteobacteria bacterium]|nr:twin-arginine translocation signal domain-containing protein [Gammaproteobacteria bacterium]
MKDSDRIDHMQSRRDFLNRALGVAGGVAAATFLSPSQTFAAWPPGETPRYEGRAKVNDAYEMYTESEYWSEEDVDWWEGRRVAGFPIGVIQLSANIPMIPGNMGNATTFGFPLLFEKMEVTGDMVVSTKPHPEVLRRSVEAAKILEQQGVRAIVGNCGFFANYQQDVAAAINVPFFGSSLMQIPLILMSLGPKQKLGIITADGPKLEAAPALENCGLTDRSRVVVTGAEETSEMKRILTTSGSYNPRKFELQLVDIAKTMVEQNPEISAILLECTELPPHARAIQKAVAMPVWGFPTMVNWIYQGVVRRNFSGFV